MQISKETKSSVKSALVGAVGGAILLAIIGFNWGGWVTGGTAEKKSAERADAAVTQALAPICVEKFRGQPDAATQLISLQKLAPYEQRGFVEKGGWATPTGGQAALIGQAGRITY
jgi:hypothetical protein